MLRCFVFLINDVDAVIVGANIQFAVAGSLDGAYAASTYDVLVMIADVLEWTLLGWNKLYTMLIPR